MQYLRRMALALALGGVVVAGAEPPGPPALSTEGGTIVYTARSGDTPARVAEMFGIPPEQFSAFLRANGITDAARVPAGFRYRVPNPLAARVSALEAQAAKLEHEAQASAERARALEAELVRAQAASAAAEAEHARVVRLERLWPLAKVGLVLLGLVTLAALATARRALGALAAAERRAQALDAELEQKRRTNLAERQESARRILALEERIRELERPRGPSTLVSVK